MELLTRMPERQSGAATSLAELPLRDGAGSLGREQMPYRNAESVRDFDQRPHRWIPGTPFQIREIAALNGGALGQMLLAPILFCPQCPDSLCEQPDSGTFGDRQLSMISESGV